VLGRALARIAGQCKRGALPVVDHARAVTHRLLEISRAAKSLTPHNQRRMKESYAKLLALTGHVVRQVVQRISMQVLEERSESLERIAARVITLEVAGDAKSRSWGDRAAQSLAGQSKQHQMA
jgi:hypothetical protein